MTRSLRILLLASMAFLPVRLLAQEPLLSLTPPAADGTCSADPAVIVSPWDCLNRFSTSGLSLSASSVSVGAPLTLSWCNPYVFILCDPNPCPMWIVSYYMLWIRVDGVWSVENSWISPSATSLTVYPTSALAGKTATVMIRSVDTSGDFIDSNWMSFSVSSATGTCVPGTNTLCIDDVSGDRRFRVAINWSTVQGGGQGGSARAIVTSSIGVSRGGLFSFFAADNPEVLVKVLNGCGVNNRFWVFISAGTNVGFTAAVTDTRRGTLRNYTNPDVTAAFPVQDINAFVCP